VGIGEDRAGDVGIVGGRTATSAAAAAAAGRIVCVMDAATHWTTLPQRTAGHAQS